MGSTGLVTGSVAWPVVPLKRVMCVVPSRRGVVALERGRLLPISGGGTLISLAQNGSGIAAEDASSHLADVGDVRVDTAELPEGTSPVQAVVDEAHRRDADLIVVPHERHGLKDRLFGSLAEHLVRQARRPVLVINKPVEGPYRDVLVAVDFDDTSHACMQTALRITRDTGATLRVLHVYDTSYALVLHNAAQSAADVSRYMERQREEARLALERFVEPYRAEAPELKLLLQAGDPHGEIRKVANRCESDLVVVGQHGFKNIAHALLGSVAEATLRGAQADVLVAAPQRTETH